MKQTENVSVSETAVSDVLEEFSEFIVLFGSTEPFGFMESVGSVDTPFESAEEQEYDVRQSPNSVMNKKNFFIA